MCSKNLPIGQIHTHSHTHISCMIENAENPHLIEVKEKHLSCMIENAENPHLIEVKEKRTVVK